MDCLPLRVRERFFLLRHEALLGLSEQGLLYLGQSLVLKLLDRLLNLVEGVAVALQKVDLLGSFRQRRAVVVFENKADAGPGSLS